MMNKMMMVAMATAMFAVNAQAAQGGAEIVGLGLVKCKDFTAAKEGKAGPAYLIWAQGFMSALNMSRAHEKKPTKSLGDGKENSPEVQMAVLGMYCAKNPERDFAAATINLYGKMPTR